MEKERGSEMKASGRQVRVRNGKEGLEEGENE